MLSTASASVRCDQHLLQQADSSSRSNCMRATEHSWLLSAIDCNHIRLHAACELLYGLHSLHETIMMHKSHFTLADCSVIVR